MGEGSGSECDCKYNKVNNGISKGLESVSQAYYTEIYNVTHLKESENDSTPYLDVVYGVDPMIENLPNTLAVLMILPFSFFTKGRKVTVVSMRPRRLTLKTSV